MTVKKKIKKPKNKRTEKQRAKKIKQSVKKRVVAKQSTKKSSVVRKAAKNSRDSKGLKKTSHKTRTSRVVSKKSQSSRSTRVRGKPQTMEELLKQTGFQLRGFKRGEVIEGILSEKTKKVLYFDVGGKSEAMVIDREMKAAADYIKELKVGDKVQAVVTQPENDRGQTLLSLKKAASEHLWKEFEEKFETQEVVKVRGKEVNQGGLIVIAKGLQGFIPGSQFGKKLVGKVKQLINREIEVKVIEVNRAKNRLIFSEREVSEAGLLKAQKDALARVKIGEELDGEVIRVMNFGLFVKVNTNEAKGRSSKTAKATKKKRSRATKKKKPTSDVVLEGLVHISEISWEKVEDPKQYYQEGDRVKVKVLAVDKSSGRLNLSIKQLEEDPWEKIEKKYPKESKVKGKIVKLAPFGAFVYLEAGIEGLIHLSKIPAEKSLKVGDKVDCFIESVDKENRRMSLGLVLKEKPVGYK